MARIRSVKPEYWTDPRMGHLSRDARLLYIALWNHADEHGRLLGDPRLIKGQAFPYDDDVTPSAIDALLDELADAGRVTRYTHCGDRYLHLPNLVKHQRLESRIVSRLPEPPLTSGNTPAELVTERLPEVDADEYALLYVAGSRLQGAGDNTSSSADADATASVIALVPDPVPTFVDFWGIYPRRTHRQPAEAAWDKAVRRVKPEVIVASATRYAMDPNLPEEEFRPHPATWLNKDLWENGPCPPRAVRQQAANRGSNSSGLTAADVARAALARAEAASTRAVEA